MQFYTYITHEPYFFLNLCLLTFKLLDSIQCMYDYCRHEGPATGPGFRSCGPEVAFGRRVSYRSRRRPKFVVVVA